MGWTCMVKATFLTPTGFIGHALLSEVCSNVLICMKAHVADVRILVTSTAEHNDKGSACEWSSSVAGKGQARQLAIRYDMKAAWQVLD